MGKSGCFSKIQTSICGIVRHWHAAFWRRFSQCFFVGCANKREYCGRLSELTIINGAIVQKRVLEAVFHELCETARLETPEKRCECCVVWSDTPYILLKL